MSHRASVAAQYLRMSTDAQDLSIEIQTAAIASYAQRQGLTIAATYTDAGRSGLTLHKRPAMQGLLRDVAQKDCAFGVVLVYDISRWGRFQDTDASAYHEYHCRMHGVQVRYVQEPFGDLDSPLASLLKGLKRVMAAEYSRELGVKTRAGQGIALQRGFHMGSLPALGISRMAVSKQSGARRPLAAEDHKSGRSEHLQWVPGPLPQVQLVQRIFRLYTDAALSVPQIVRLLNTEGHVARTGRPFTANMLYRMLACEAYAGNFVWGRRDGDKRRRAETHARFQRSEGTIAPIVPAPTWQQTQQKRMQRGGATRSRQQLLDELSSALQQNPRLTASDLVGGNLACRATYVKAFGSFAAALAQLGRTPYTSVGEACRASVDKRAVGSRLCAELLVVLQRVGIACARYKAANGCHSLCIRERVRLRVQLVWQRYRHGSPTWFLPKIYREHFDHVLLVRMHPGGSVFDSILLSADAYFRHPRWLPDTVPGASEWMTSEDQVAAKFRSLTQRPTGTVRLGTEGGR
jgi:DNA invertase Pin-like site-specific DNA recombinase